MNSLWVPLQWRHNARDGVSNHRCRNCLLSRLFRRRSQKTAPRHWPLWGKSTGRRPWQRGSNTVNVSIWWRHHVDITFRTASLALNRAIVWRPRCRWFHSLSAERCGCDFKTMISKLIIQNIVAWALAAKLLVCKYHNISLAISQHRFREWLGAGRQHAITSANDGPYLWCLCRHMTPYH